MRDRRKKVSSVDLKERRYRVAQDGGNAAAGGGNEVDFTPTRKGLTLFHCHNKFNMDRGFVMRFEVI
jgi:FtsP/CotA-like multicopper oxidase with cupredoxin domain